MKFEIPCDDDDDDNDKKERKKVKSLSHVWLCDSIDYNLPGFSVHGIFQARVLEWVAIAFSRW